MAIALYGLPEPKFDNKRNEFVVTLFNSSNIDTGESIGDDTLVKEYNLVEFCRMPRSRKEIADYFGIGTISYAMDKFVKPLLENGTIQMTMPDKPKSSKQRYYSK